MRVVIGLPTASLLLLFKDSRERKCWSFSYSPLNLIIQKTKLWKELAEVNANKQKTYQSFHQTGNIFFILVRFAMMGKTGIEWLVIMLRKRL